LVSAHRYAEAAAECEQRLKCSPDDLALLAWHATAMLCLGRLPEALEEFRRVNARERADLDRSDGRILTIGAIQWLLGRRDEAIETFESAVMGVQDGSINYGDFAGGVSQGVLLWHAGVTTRNTAARERSLEYLRERAERPQIKSWPGPLAHFVLGTASQEDVLVHACGTRDPEAAMRLVRKDVLKRRRLVNAMFYFATRSRDEGSEEECLARMRKCASIENPIVEVEWYLARGEAERADDQRP
jgi:tetratricopeptide (TPR) repeat protein